MRDIEPIDDCIAGSTPTWARSKLLERRYSYQDPRTMPPGSIPIWRERRTGRDAGQAAAIRNTGCRYQEMSATLLRFVAVNEAGAR
jgi:hypothetical protein